MKHRDKRNGELSEIKMQLYKRKEKEVENKWGLREKTRKLETIIIIIILFSYKAPNLKYKVLSAVQTILKTKQ